MCNKRKDYSESIYNRDAEGNLQQVEDENAQYGVVYEGGGISRTTENNPDYDDYDCMYS